MLEPPDPVHNAIIMPEKSTTSEDLSNLPELTQVYYTNVVFLALNTKFPSHSVLKWV